MLNFNSIYGDFELMETKILSRVVLASQIVSKGAGSKLSWMPKWLPDVPTAAR